MLRRATWSVTITWTRRVLRVFSLLSRLRSKNYSVAVQHDQAPSLQGQGVRESKLSIFFHGDNEWEWWSMHSSQTRSDDKLCFHDRRTIKIIINWSGLRLNKLKPWSTYAKLFSGQPASIKGKTWWNWGKLKKFWTLKLTQRKDSKINKSKFSDWWKCVRLRFLLIR